MDIASDSEEDRETTSEIGDFGSEMVDVTRTVFVQDIDSLLPEAALGSDDLSFNYEFYDLNCDEVLLILIKPCTLYFYGSVSVDCLAGRAEILGYIIDSAKSKVEIYSCEGSSALYISTVADENEEADIDLTVVTNLGISPMEATKICNWVRKGGCILLLSETVRKQHMRQRVGRAEKRFGLSIDKPTKMIKNKVSIPPEIHLDIVEGITVVCGGQGVGKSTSLRYLTNRALNHSKQVLYIDLDIGQPEFTLHECVSAILVDSPIIGPSYTHYCKPYRSYNVGSIDASRCVNTYIRAVELLVEECSSAFPDIPWLVNTMGFTRGVGVYITCTCIAIIKPSLVIQIDGKSSQNFPADLNVRFVQSVSSRSVAKYKLIKAVKNFTTTKDCYTFALTNKQVRWISTENYFSDSIRPSYPLIVPADFLKVFNVTDKSVIHSDQYSNIVAKPVILSSSTGLDEPPQVLDYGIIVSYVESDKIFMILTPLEPGINVMNIESILVGSLQIPSRLNKLVSPLTKGLVPYCQISRGVKTAPTLKPLKRTFRFLFEPTSETVNSTSVT